jgi:diaminopimelate decarboxylase
MDHFNFRDGVLHCEDVPLTDIAAAVGTPLYIYSTATMRRHVAVLRDALKTLENPLIAYAVKANPNAAVLTTLAREGLGADVVSGGEYRRARSAGVPADRIVFSGVGKTEEEMALAIEGGLFQLNLESLEEAETVSRVAQGLGRSVPVAFRINPDVIAKTHAKISTGAAHNKFGLPLGDALRAYEQVRQLPALKIQGVAVHIGSQLTDLAPSRAAFEKIGGLIASLRAAGHSISVADLGGGLGVPYDPAAPVPPSPQAYGEMVTQVTQGWDVRLTFEPGRLIVANAGILLSKVISVKPSPAQPFVIVDAAMNDLLRPSLYDAWHAIEAVVPRGGTMIADVVGPICESGDTFAKERTMDAVQSGDLVIFRTAGAYGAAMASTYNSRPLTPEVIVDGNRWALVRERREVEALLPETLPDWLSIPS